MRTNLPVTQNEVLLSDETLIVSKTDLKGRITYVNKDFLDISGFTSAELIGEPHNLVRHPDMPPEAFQDLWDTLKAGRPWVGYVKNRTKSGDFYWVEAHAAPVWEGTAVVGYMSVRRKAPRDKVDAAEGAYRAFREKRAAGLRIKDGWVESTGALAALGRKLRDASLSLKMMIACTLAIMVVMGATSVILGRHMAAALETQGLGELGQNLRLIKGMVEVRATAMRREAMRLNDIFAGMYPDGLSVEADGETPVLKHGKTTVNQRYDEVDRFTGLTNAVSTLFVRKGDDLVRVATSVKNEKGERAVGTLLAKDHPGRAKILAGERFTGRANLFGKDYYTSYSPIKGADGKVIGATFIGIDVSAEITALRQQIKNVKVGETGYFYVLDAMPGKDYGSLIVHPAKEGANLLGAKDADGHEFIREMLEKRQGNIRYPWMNKELGDTSAREKVVVFDTFADWQWTIGGGTYTDEFELLSRSMQRYLWLASLMVILVLVGLISWLVGRMIRNPLENHVLPVFRALSGGKYDSPLAVARNDEIGKVLQGLETMQNRLGFEVADTKRVADEMTRIKIALDNVSTGVMIADDKRNIIYTNHSVVRVLKGAEAGIRQQLPNFSADNLVGVNIDTFHKNPAHQANLLATFTQPYTAKLVIGDRHMTVTANPVINAQGERLGAVAEWQDRTAEVAVEKEVQSIVFAAAQGDFSKRLTTEGKEGFFEGLAIGMNQLLETASSGLSAVAEVLNALARGDLTQSIEGDYEGTFGQLKDDTNTTVERLREVVGRIKEASDAINVASKEIAAGNQDLSSRTEEQASSLEETSSSMEELNATVKQNAENAKQANELAHSSN
ncbi:MAG: Cache 3/Cache 2 fusion domain-containing protein, partial [Rhodocyclaceae bacterium]|nr:Cache 3/Cache 2 fusion domain-containing protein [Rhodocyclaceae bacterium]